MDKMHSFNWVVDEKSHGSRLLTFIKNRVDFSTNDVRYALDHQCCVVNGMRERFGSRRLNRSDRVEIFLSKRPSFRFDKTRILFEDDSFLVYDKPVGIATTGDESLASLLKLEVVHRLDRDTSGLLLFAKIKKMRIAIEELFRKREIEKSYLAIVLGVLKKKEGMIENYMGRISQKEGEVKMGILNPPYGAYAQTRYQVKREKAPYSLVSAFPKTGRTHQIRLHLSSIGHPILGDLNYGERKCDGGFFALRPLLHAESIRFIHPLTQQEMRFSAPLPPDFKEALVSLKLS